jgi:hypothetical protein
VGVARVFEGNFLGKIRCVGIWGYHVGNFFSWSPSLRVKKKKFFQQLKIFFHWNFLRNISNQVYISLVQSGELSPNQPPLADERIFSVLKKCFVFDPQLRPSMNEIYEQLSEISTRVAEVEEGSEISTFMEKKLDYEHAYKFLSP